MSVRSDLRGEFSKWSRLQRVGVHKARAQPGSEVDKQWHDRVLDYRAGDAPDFGAVWVTYFPTHMIELYPHVLVLSTLYPKSPQETVNVVEFYRSEEHTSELQSLMRISYAVFCLNKKTQQTSTSI